MLLVQDKATAAAQHSGSKHGRKKSKHEQAPEHKKQKQTNCIIVAGGSDDKNCVADCEKFDVERDEWQKIAALNKARKYAAAAAHADSVFVFGGQSDKFLDDVEQYNTATNKWTVLSARLKVARSFLAAACLDDCIHVLGGFNLLKLAEASSAVEHFDLRTKQFTKVSRESKLHTPSYAMAATSVTAEHVCALSNPVDCRLN